MPDYFSGHIVEIRFEDHHAIVRMRVPQYFTDSYSEEGGSLIQLLRTRSISNLQAAHRRVGLGCRSCMIDCDSGRRVCSHLSTSTTYRPRDFLHSQLVPAI